MLSTVGAALKWVMPSLRSSSQIRSGSTRGSQTWVAPPAETAQGKHQPLQWNIGRVHRYWLVEPRPGVQRHRECLEVGAPVGVHDALGRPVVPEV